MTADAMARSAGPRHEALLYDDRHAFVAAVEPWVDEGLRAGDEVLVMVPADNAASLARRLGARGRRVTFTPPESLGRPVGPMFRGLRALISEAAAGRRSLRLVAEHPRAGEGRLIRGELREFVHHDAICAAGLRGAAVSVLCAYPGHRLHDDEARLVREAHPLLRRGAEVGPSAGHREAAALVAEGQRRVGRYVTPPSGERVPLRDPGDLARLREVVRVVAGRAGTARRGTDDFAVAVSEIATNALVHGSGDAVAAVWASGGEVVCDVRDGGPGLADPLAGYEPADARSRRGRGLWLARQLSTLVEVGRSETGTLVRLHLVDG